MGKNKLAKFAEMEGFTHVIQDPVNLSLAEDHSLKGKWNVSFFRNDLPVVLELGCGKGEYTLALAEKYPQRNYIGVDIKGARMHTGARQALHKGLSNVAFLRTRIENLLCYFSDDEVDEIWLTFPDPQMKKLKKRLTSTYFLRQYTRILKDKGVIHLKTDSDFMFEYTVAVSNQNNLNIVYKTNDLYKSDLLNELLGTKTFYEKQWIERGINIKYLAFMPGKKVEWTEPAQVFEKDTYRSFGRSARV